jgi:type IV pilus assembly protein PilQ
MKGLKSEIQKKAAVLNSGLLILLILGYGFWPSSFAQEAEKAAPIEAQTAIVETSSTSENVTLDFKDADIRNVLKVISFKARVNIVPTPEVMGNVSIRLVDVPWEEALKVILRTYGFGYDKRENIITVAPIEKLTAQKRQEMEFEQIQPTITDVFNLRYLDAQDARKALAPQLSPRGRITILELTGQSGWEFGTDEPEKRKRISEGRISRSKTLIVTDIPPVMEKLKEVLQKIDIVPQQILIEAKLIEVSHNKLRDIGFNWGTGVDGQTSLSTSRQEVTVYYPTEDDQGYPTKSTYKDVIPVPQIPMNSAGTKILGAQSIPAAGIAELLFQKLTGTELEFVVKALEQKGYANTLSAPNITTLNNQEASILIGKKFPLIKTSISTETGSVTGQSLDKYQDIGIQLNVVPQIVGDDKINLIIHPAVTSSTQTVKAVNVNGQTMAEYPIILTREADTQVLLKSGETVVMGGLLTDAKTKTIKGIPILKDIPLLGLLFRSESITTDKLDLLIFISARIIKETEFSPEEIGKLEKRLERQIKEKATEPKKKEPDK